MTDSPLFRKPIIKLEEERTPDLSFLDKELFQPEKGYRFTADALLLADTIHPQPDEVILEFGGGCGIIPIIIAKLNPRVKIISLEIQEELALCAKKNIELYELQNQIEIINEDARVGWQKFTNGSFQRVVTNPPYRESGKGKLNPSSDKAIARHEVSLDLSSIIQWSSFLLQPGGKLNFIFPSSRYREATILLEKNNFDLTDTEEVKRSRNSVRILEACYKP
jgi:tRNA1Val (adenine37-N6)-methyltransferase